MPEARLDRVVVACPSCAASIAAPALARGALVRCPACRAEFRLPAHGTSSGAGWVALVCDHCGLWMQVPGYYAGRRACCPECTAALSVPPPQQRVASRAHPGVTPGEPSVADLLAAASGAALSSPPRSATTTYCPICRATMAADDVVCVACGYDARTGTRHEQEFSGSEHVAATGEPAWLRGHAVVRLALGCAGSVIGAAAGAVAWVAFAIGTHNEWLWLALLPGGLAGLGMYLGAREAGPLPGWLAAAVALVSLTLTRAVIVQQLAQLPLDTLTLVSGGLLSTGGWWAGIVLGLAALLAFLVAALGAHGLDDLRCGQ